MQVLFLQTAGGDPIMSLLFFGGMILIFWFFLMRPQAKRQKQQKAFSEGLQRGADVVTASGMLGKINKIEDEIVTLEVAKGTFIRVTRNAISREMTESIHGKGE